MWRFLTPGFGLLVRVVTSQRSSLIPWKSFIQIRIHQGRCTSTRWTSHRAIYSIGRTSQMQRCIYLRQPSTPNKLLYVRLLQTKNGAICKKCIYPNLKALITYTAQVAAMFYGPDCFSYGKRQTQEIIVIISDIRHKAVSVGTLANVVKIQLAGTSRN